MEPVWLSEQRVMAAASSAAAVLARGLAFNHNDHGTFCRCIEAVMPLFMVRRGCGDTTDASECDLYSQRSAQQE